MGFKLKVDGSTAKEICAKYPIFERIPGINCCVRVKGTNLAHHFTEGFVDCPWWIKSPLKDTYFVDMTKYIRGLQEESWLSLSNEDIFSNIPDKEIREELIAVFSKD